MNRGLASQFWSLKEPDIPPLDLKIEIVKKFPKEVYNHAHKVKMWAFIVGKKTPTLVGFAEDSSGRFEQPIVKAWATVNENGVMQELLVRNFSYAYILTQKTSASYLSFLLKLLTDDLIMYDGRQLQFIIDDEWIEMRGNKRDG